MPSETMRVITSVGPPAAKGTTTVTGRLGKGCCAREAGAASADGIAASSSMRRCMGQSSLILSVCIDGVGGEGARTAGTSAG